MGGALLETNARRIKNEGRTEGRSEGEAGIVLKMYKNGFTPEQIASAIDKDLQEIKAIIENRVPTLV